MRKDIKYQDAGAEWVDQASDTVRQSRGNKYEGSMESSTNGFCHNVFRTGFPDQPRAERSPFPKPVASIGGHTRRVLAVVVFCLFFSSSSGMSVTQKMADIGFTVCIVQGPNTGTSGDHRTYMSELLEKIVEKGMRVALAAATTTSAEMRLSVVNRVVNGTTKAAVQESLKSFGGFYRTRESCFKNRAFEMGRRSLEDYFKNITREAPKIYIAWTIFRMNEQFTNKEVWANKMFNPWVQSANTSGMDIFAAYEMDELNVNYVKFYGIRSGNHTDLDEYSVAKVTGSLMAAVDRHLNNLNCTKADGCNNVSPTAATSNRTGSDSISLTQEIPKTKSPAATTSTGSPDEPLRRYYVIVAFVYGSIAIGTIVVIVGITRQCMDYRRRKRERQEALIEAGMVLAKTIEKREKVPRPTDTSSRTSVSTGRSNKKDAMM